MFYGSVKKNFANKFSVGPKRLGMVWKPYTKHGGGAYTSNMQLWQYTWGQ
jgi:hypothetical protein